MKSPRRYSGFAGAVLLALACAQPVSTARASEPPATVRAAIELAGNDWVAAFKSGDRERLLGLYAPDASVALHDQPMHLSHDLCEGVIVERASDHGCQRLPPLQRSRLIS